MQCSIITLPPLSKWMEKIYMYPIKLTSWWTGALDWSRQFIDSHRRVKRGSIGVRRVKIREESILKALEQNWLHIRHIENGRLQFTYVYAVLTVGILTILESFDFEISISNPYSILLVFFLALFSFFGLVWTVKANLEITNHMVKIWFFTRYFRIKPYMGLPIDFPFKIHAIFEVFYSIVLSFWVSIFLIFFLVFFAPKLLILPLFIGLSFCIYCLTRNWRIRTEQEIIRDQERLTHTKFRDEFPNTRRIYGRKDIIKSWFMWQLSRLKWWHKW